MLLILHLIDTITGANPSTEEGEEALEDGATTVNDVVHSFRLQQTTFDKKSYLTYLKVCRPCTDVTTFSSIVLYRRDT